ncbi:MAG: hydantoinase B/oxoprolinase family protein [Aromatoleum sp.]|nr:hydantoinase B/oxoprolinase family protein [Aromatoleum sp.]
MKVSPIDYAVVSQALHAVANEMGAKLIRSAYSTVLREARDGAAALLDREGSVVAQADLIPMQLGPMGMTIKPCLERHPLATLVEGDFLISNDPYNGGQHLPDVFIFTPIFFDRQIVAFSGSVAHHLDLGGGSPGLDTESTDIFQEGLRLPPSRYNLKRDWNGGTFERLVAANVRVPDLTIGDFNAQHAANAIGAARVQQLCAKYGAELVTEVMRQFIDYSERRMRAAIAKVPNGIYYGEDAVDDDGTSDRPLVVKVKVEVLDEDIRVDFAGTCAQVMRNVNCPLSSTHAATLSCIKSVVTSASIPFNEGVKRPIHITVPEGSLLNPLPPAPVRARMEAGYRVFNALMKALAQAVPERVIASGFDTTTVVCLSCQAETGFKVNLDIFGGGFGAGPTGDGCDAVDLPLSNCSNNPVEVLDAQCDFFRVVGYRLEPDSFGHGEFRGGAGFSRRYEVLADGVKLAIYSDRFRIRPAGLFGGTAAMTGHCTIFRGGERIEMASKSSYALRKGDIVEMFVGGGGGYGSPSRRAPKLVERDLHEGLLTQEAARECYGVGAGEPRSASAR